MATPRTHPFVAARLAALGSFEVADLAELFRRVPALVEVLHSGAYPTLHDMASVTARQPPGHHSPARQPPGHHSPARNPALADLAQLLAARTTIYLTLDSLDRFHRQLIALAAWHGGRLTRDQAVAEVGAEHAAALEAAADRLRRLVLAERSSAWLALLPGVDTVVKPPGVPARPYLEQLVSDELSQALRKLGVSRPPTKKAERLDLFEQRLRDPETVGAQLRTMPDDVREVFSRLVEQSPRPVKDLGIDFFAPGYYQAHFSSAGRQHTPLHWLVERGLAGVDFSGQTAFVWLDVLVGLQGGRLFARWQSAPLPAQPLPLADPGPWLPAVLTTLEALLVRWTADPPPALASGGLGVRAVRAAAKDLGVAPGVVGLVANLMAALGVLGLLEITPARRRGRNWTPGEQAWAPTAAMEEWGGRDGPERWALLVQAWLEDRGLDEREGLPDRIAPDLPVGRADTARACLLNLLEPLPTGTGVTIDELVALADFHHPGKLPPGSHQGLLDAARTLGLVPCEGPIGLTELGRALLQGPEEVRARLPRASQRFTVQADHSIVAPPDLAPALLARLERYADCESGAGARLYRLSETRLAACLEAGETADDVVEFLSGHTNAPLPQNVAYLVADVARRHGQLRAGAAGSYLRCDDPGLLARAAAVKAAKLRLLAPTVAVSPLATDKLLAVLRGRGLMPVAEGADGAQPPARRRIADPAWGAPGGLPPVRGRDAAEHDVEAIAARILGREGTGRVPRRARRAG